MAMIADGGKMLLPILLLAVFASWTPTGARVIHKRAAFYIANDTMCIVDGEVFRNGDPVPTDDECERCTCRPPGFSCVLRDCDTKPGCKAVRRAGECCPDYVCGCVHNNRVYEDGEVIKDLQNACYTCRCHGSSISCTFADCLFRGDCPPDYVQGECCPRYDHCPPLSTSAAPPTVFTPASSTHPPIIQQQEQFFNLTTQHLEKFTNEDVTVTVEDILHSGTSTWTTPSYDTSTLPPVTVKFTLTDGPITSISDFDVTTLTTVLPVQTSTYTETTKHVIPDETRGGLTTTQESSTSDFYTSTPSSADIFTHSSPTASSSSTGISSESSTVGYYEQSSAYTDSPAEVSENEYGASTISTEKDSLEISTNDYQTSSSTETTSSESSTVDYKPSFLTESAPTESSSIDNKGHLHTTESDSLNVSTTSYDLTSPTSESASSDIPVAHEILSTSTESDFTESASIDYDSTNSSESTSPDISTMDHDTAHLHEGSSSENFDFDYDTSSPSPTSASPEKPFTEYETSLNFTSSDSSETSTVDHDAFSTTTESAFPESSSSIYDTSTISTQSASLDSLDKDKTSSFSESHLETFDYITTSTTVPPESSSYIETHVANQTDEGFNIHDLNKEKDTTTSIDSFENVASETFESEDMGLNEFTLENATAHSTTNHSIDNQTLEFMELGVTSTLPDSTEIESSTADENIKFFTEIYNQTNNLIESQPTDNSSTSQFTFSTDASINEEINTTEYSTSPTDIIYNEAISTNDPSKEPEAELYSTVKPFNALHSTESTEIPKIEETTQTQVPAEAGSIDDEITSSISEEVIKFELPDSVSNSSELLTNQTYESFETLGYEEGHSKPELSEETLDVDQSNEVTDLTNLTDIETIFETTNEGAFEYTTQTTYNTSEPLNFENHTSIGEINSSKIYPDMTTVELETVSVDSVKTNDLITNKEYSEVVEGGTETTEDVGSKSTHDIIKYTTRIPSYESVTEHSSTDDVSTNFNSESSTELSEAEVYPTVTTEIVSEIFSDTSSQTKDFITKDEYPKVEVTTAAIESSDSKLSHEINKYTTGLPNNEDKTDYSNIDNTSNNFGSESTTEAAFDSFSSEITTEAAFDNFSSESTTEAASDSLSSESTTEAASDSFSSESTTKLPESVSLDELSIEDNKSFLASTVEKNFDNNDQDKIVPHLSNENEINENITISNESGIEKHESISSFLDESITNQFEETEEASKNNTSSFQEHFTASTKTPITTTELNPDDNSFSAIYFNEENNFNEQDSNESITPSEKEISQNETQEILPDFHNEETTFNEYEYPNTFTMTVTPLTDLNTTINSTEDGYEIQQQLSISTQDSIISSESDLATEDSLKDLNLSKDHILIHENLTSPPNNLKESTQTPPLEDNDSNSEISTSESFSENLHHTTLEQLEGIQHTETLQTKTATTVNDLNEKTEIDIVTLHPLKTDLSGLLTVNNKQFSTDESQKTDENPKSNYNDITKVTEPFNGNPTVSVSTTTVVTPTSDINDMNTHPIYTNEKEASVASDKSTDSPIINIFSGSVMTTPGIPGEGLHIKNALFHDNKLNVSTTLVNGPVTESNENASLETDQIGINQSTDFTMSYDIADAEDLTTSDELNTDLSNSTQNENFLAAVTEADDDTHNISNATQLQYEDLNSEANWPIEKNVSDYLHNVTPISEEPISDSNFTQVDEAVTKLDLSTHIPDNDNLFDEELNATHLNIDDYSVLDAEDDSVNDTPASELVTGSTENVSTSFETNSTPQEFSETLIESSTPEASEGFIQVQNTALISEISPSESTSTLNEVNWSDVTNESMPSPSIIPHYAEENSIKTEIYTTETTENSHSELDLTKVPQTTYIPVKQDNQESGFTVSNTHSISTQELEEASTITPGEIFSFTSPTTYESTQFTNPTPQATEFINNFSDKEEIDSYDSGNETSTFIEHVQGGISVEETSFDSSMDNQNSLETSTAPNKIEEHTNEESQFETSQFSKTPTEAIYIVSNAETISNDDNNSEVSETPMINTESEVDTLSNSGYLTYNNHKSKDTDLVSKQPNESMNTSTNHVQILFGQTSNQLFTHKPDTETSISETHSEKDDTDSVETYTIDENKYGIALHEYADLTSTSEQAQTDSSTVNNPEIEGEDTSFYDHEYDANDVTSEQNINFTKSSIANITETPQYFDTTEDPSITQDTSNFEFANSSSNFSSGLSPTVEKQSNSSEEKTESSVESSTALQDQFSVMGYLGELFSGINVYSSYPPTENGITENNDAATEISTIDDLSGSNETFHDSELKPGQSSNINFSNDRTSSESSFTEVENKENSSAIIPTQHEFERETFSGIYNKTQDNLESSENQTIKSNTSFNFSVEKPEVKYPADDLNYFGIIDSSIENSNQSLEASLSSSLSAVEENVDSIGTTETYETVEYIPSENSKSNQSDSDKVGQHISSNMLPLKHASDRHKEISSNVEEGNTTELSASVEGITFATTVASYVLSGEKIEIKSAVNISEENSSFEPPSEKYEGNSSNTSDSKLIDLDPKESVDAPLYIENLNKSHEKENHSIDFLVNRTNENINTEGIKAGINQTQSLRPYSLFDVISNVFKAPGYDAEVHSSFLKEQVDYSKKEKPVTVVKRDTNQLEERQIASMYEAAIADAKNPAAEPSHRLNNMKTASSDGNFAFQKSNQPAFASVTSSFIIVDRARDDSQSRRKIPIRNSVGDIQEIELPASVTFPSWVKFPSKSTAKKEEEHH